MRKILLHACASLAIIFILCPGCAAPGTGEPRIGLVGAPEHWQRMDRALARMGEPFHEITSITGESLEETDLVILPQRAFQDNAGGVADKHELLLEYVHSGGCLLVFAITPEGYRPEFLPYEIRFALEDPSGWGNIDFSEEIAVPEHPVFNLPHRLTYLAGLEEPSRVDYTGPEWRILLAKDPRHPCFDAKIKKQENNVGSIFEAAYGSGQILVCQPIIDRYHAGGAEIVPHPLEAGVMLFENVVEYMKEKAFGAPLPVAAAQAVPWNGAAKQPVRLSARLSRSAAGPLTCAWDFGDGTSSNQPAPEHVFSKDGVYWPTVTVTDSRGRVDRATCRVEIGPAKKMHWNDHLLEALMHRYYPDAGLVGPNYRTALVLDGMLDVYKRTGDTEIVDYVKLFFAERLITNWETGVYKSNTKPDVNSVDIYSLMTSAYRIYKITGEEIYRKMALEVWDQSLAADWSLPAGSIWSPWTWGGRRTIVDFTYFKAYLRALAWEETGRMKLLDEAAGQMIKFAGYFQDPADSLFFQAIDLDRKAYFCSPDRPSGLNDTKWGRANGWVALAFAELMPRLPADHPRRAELVRIIRNFFSGVLSAQDPETGLWAQIIDKRNYPGMWLETTSTSMFVYSLVRLVEIRVLTEEPFLSAARRGYNGLQQRIKLGHWDYPYLSDACEGTMPRPDLDCWIRTHRRDNDFHVLGPFLMAEEALWRAAPPRVAVIGNLNEHGSHLGKALNFNGVYFYQVPDLYTAGDLARFDAVLVDRRAIDRNTANVAAYSGMLLDYARHGGRVLVFQQEDKKLMAGVFPGLQEAAEKDPASKFVKVSRGQGELLLCRIYPEIDEQSSPALRAAELSGFAFLREFQR